MHVVLISCASAKLDRAAPAALLYVSPLFKLMLRYAQQLDPRAIFVLSAKHGLVGLDETIEPYDVTLNTMTLQERKAWADGVLAQLRTVANTDADSFTLLAGAKYREFLEPALQHCNVPLAGLSIGRQLQWLRARTEARD